MAGPRRDAELLALDRAHVWHPYGPMPARSEPLLVRDAAGARLRLADGRELVDGMSSWWCAVHGYRHPALDAAAADQLERMAHVMFGGLTHEPAIELAGALLERTPASLEHVFFADSGSVAVEVALKMALQYWRARGRPERTRMLSLRGGYHGDTFGAMGVCDPLDGMHSLFSGVLAQNVFAPRPPGGVERALEEAWAQAVGALFERHGAELAAVVIEPVVQGAGGMWFYSGEYVGLLRELCDRYEVLLVLDEIATGFGRSGTYFACERAGVAPDLMCVGKALTGGYLTLAATLCSAAVAQAISGGEGGALMHGPTYMANPLACAVALASLELLEGSWEGNVARVERILARGLEPLRERSGVADVRVLGAIGVVELDHGVDVAAASAAARVELDHGVDVAAASAAAVASGVWLRPFRNLVYCMPPYVASEEELGQIVAGIAAAVGVA